MPLPMTGKYIASAKSENAVLGAQPLNAVTKKMRGMCNLILTSAWNFDIFYSSTRNDPAFCE